MFAQITLNNSAKASVPVTETEAAGTEEKRTIMNAEPGNTYIIKEINTDDDEMNSFLFRLGC